MQSNIIGIINENGTFVVKYLCSAYGKMCDITNLEASTIGTINPFRYKVIITMKKQNFII